MTGTKRLLAHPMHAKAILAALGTAGALLVVSAAPASASGVDSLHQVTGQVAGQQVTQGDRAQVSLAAAPQAIAAASRRITARNAYANATGTLSWSGGLVGKVRARGRLSDGRTLASTSYLILRWRALGKNYRKQVAGVANGRAVSFDRSFRFAGAPGSITLTVCSRRLGKWRCGVAQRF
jgi:hypothetical protein